jgi:hypothetical protein
MLTDTSVYKTQVEGTIPREKVRFFRRSVREGSLAGKSGESGQYAGRLYWMTGVHRNLGQRVLGK